MVRSSKSMRRPCMRACPSRNEESIILFKNWAVLTPYPLSLRRWPYCHTLFKSDQNWRRMDYGALLRQKSRMQLYVPCQNLNETFDATCLSSSAFQTTSASSHMPRNVRAWLLWPHMLLRWASSKHKTKRVMSAPSSFQNRNRISWGWLRSISQTRTYLA